MMSRKETAVISDIHGNSWALERVLADIESRNIETIINLGDSLYGPLDPKGTFALLLENDAKMKSISGNQDRFILENLNTAGNSSTLEYMLESVDDNMVDWLRQLSFDYVHNDSIYCCHASPAGDTVVLLEKLESDHSSVKTDTEIEELLSDIQQQVVVCGHSHVPRIVKSGSRMVINPGSVGLPSYDDDEPVYHKMESFTPHAKYCVLTTVNGTVDVDQVTLSYEYERAAALAEKNNRPDWAEWISTGRA